MAGSGSGYWTAAADGSVTGCRAPHLVSTGAHSSGRIVGIAATGTGKGYWLVGADGGVFSFGDARFHGSTGAMHLSERIVGIAPTVTGKGYWLVGADGGVFSFGDAKFYGSAVAAGARIVGIARG